MAVLVVVSPPPVLQFVDQNGAPLVGGQLFSYAGGTTTKTPTYTDSTGATPNTNPIILNALGSAPSGIWVPPTTNIKFVLAPAGDSDPPSAPIWTQDNVAAPTTAAGTMALQNANNVNITGGTISVGTLTCTGATTVSTLTASGNATLNGATLTVAGTSTFTGAATFSSTAAFAGVVTMNNSVNINSSFLTLSSNVGGAIIQIQTIGVGFAANISLQTGTSTRWTIYKDASAETGSNVGSDFNIDSYSDVGALNFNALRITRATGTVTIQALTVLGAAGILIAGTSKLAFTASVSGAGSGAGTISNAPAAGNPQFWQPITINGTQYYFPCWHV